MTQVAIGTSLTVSVDPRPFFVPTGIEVDPGQRYSFTASGKWKDWFRIVGPEGWKLWPLHLRNRVPRAAFFCLCGCVWATTITTRFPLAPAANGKFR